jgi:hypothetical protein
MDKTYKRSYWHWLMKKLAVAAILWAILIPPLLCVIKIASGHNLPRRLHLSAELLRMELPKESTGETALISVNSVSTTANIVDGIANNLEQRSKIDTVETIISSVIIIILSICMLSSYKRDEKTAESGRRED